MVGDTVNVTGSSQTSCTSAVLGQHSRGVGYVNREITIRRTEYLSGNDLVLDGVLTNSALLLAPSTSIMRYL